MASVLDSLGFQARVKRVNAEVYRGKVADSRLRIQIGFEARTLRARRSYVPISAVT